MIQQAQYGSWKSPIETEMVAKSSKRFADITVSKKGVYYWIESRPSEKGRCTVMSFDKGKLQECLPPEYNARSRVHEYGGGAIGIGDKGLYFVNFQDQKIYLYDLDTHQVHPITDKLQFRYADFVLDQDRLFCVREEHPKKGEPINTIVCIDSEEKVLVSGDDFYASPQLSPDRKKLAFLSWNHPNMPWDGTTLNVLDLSTGKMEIVAGGKEESIFQPQWSSEGDLFFVSDRTGFWNLYRNGVPICPMEAEFGLPQWVFGMSTYAVIDGKTVACIYRMKGRDHLGVLDLETGILQPIELPFTMMTAIKKCDRKVLFQGGAPNQPTAIVQVDLDTGRYEEIRSSQELAIDPAFISHPQAITFSTTDKREAFAFFYPPLNPDYKEVENEKPPLIVNCHGGPTAHCSSSLNLETQFWTTRGFAVLDLDYAGSSGYGRAYRDRLKGNWGIADVEDAESCVRDLTARGWIDPERVVIKGGSAGGYTVLRALTTTHLFRIGTSYYGVSDLEALAKETHKFESHYVEGLVPPSFYRERSPIHHLDRFQAALLLLQGMEDKVVLPNQSEMMFEAVKQKGFPVAYVAFENEQHGFRQAENIQYSKEAELYFYSKVFQIPLHETLSSIVIENL